MAEARIAFQKTNNPTGNWNSFNSTTLGGAPTSFSATSLIDIDSGSATGWTLAGTEISIVGDATDGVNSTGSGDAAWVNQAVISDEMWYASTTARGFDFVFAGLDNAKTYTIELYGSIDVATTGNVSIYTIGATGLTLETGGNNVSNIARFSGVSPSSNQIALAWRRDASATDRGALSAMRIIEDAGSGGTATPSQATLTASGLQPSINPFTNVRIREVLVNEAGSPVANATGINLIVWYAGVPSGVPDLSYSALTTDANGTTSWSLATGSLVYNQNIFYVATDGGSSLSMYTCARMIPSYE